MNPEKWTKAGLENSIFNYLGMIRNQATMNAIWEEWQRDRDSHKNMVIIFNKVYAEIEAQWA